jgi:protein-ribulosamine 3-kinase
VHKVIPEIALQSLQASLLPSIEHASEPASLAGTSTPNSLEIISASPVFGGCINRCFRVQTNQGNYFLKWNDALRFPNMFRAEADGLNLLRQYGGPKIPEVIDFRTSNLLTDDNVIGQEQSSSPERITWIWMEWLEAGHQKPDYWEQFGRELAALHQITSTTFGGHPDNYIGSLPQCNANCDSWCTFYRESRLTPMVHFARKALGGQLPPKTEAALSQFDKRMEYIFPLEKASLQHGDLWSGNAITGPNGYAALIDPAVSFGNREADLAMTLLFGGFEAPFYDAYHEAFPLENGWRDRVAAHQVYPLLVHVALFGASYLDSLDQALARYTR